MSGRTDCNGCKWAKWYRTVNGRLHPGGEGRCTFPYKINPLPGAFHWGRYQNVEPYGGYISRREPLNRPCPYYERGEYQEKEPAQ
jgi:hypothetical protein